MWIILPEVHYCTVEQVSHFGEEKSKQGGGKFVKWKVCKVGMSDPEGVAHPHKNTAQN
jgi:hypothetical protein